MSLKRLLVFAFALSVTFADDLSQLPLLKTYSQERLSSFDRYFKMTIEHGHANHRSDNFYTTAYWYQQGPHRLRKPLPPLDQRMPRLINVEGPTIGKP